MNKIATLVGCGIGDALGNFCEMRPANHPLIVEWDGLFKAGGTFWKGEAGQWTDDTCMTISLATSLIEGNGFDPKRVASGYLDWYKTGNTRGIGNTTAGAMVNLKEGRSWQESGLEKGFDGLPAAGNGTAMRVSPIGLFYRNDLDAVIKYAMQDAMITHNAHEPKMGSIAVALAVALLANGQTDTLEVLKIVEDILVESVVKDKINLAINFIDSGAAHLDALANIGSSGYVPETVGAAFYCLAATDSFKDAVVLAVKCGGDTDSTAAVVGAMAGTLYGLDSIPAEYKDNVEGFELLQLLTNEIINNQI